MDVERRPLARLRREDADVAGVEKRATLPGAFGRTEVAPKRLGVRYEPIRGRLIHAPTAVLDDREAR